MRDRDEFELDDHEERDLDGDDDEDAAEREEGAGMMFRGMSTSQVRQIMRMESYYVQNRPPPPMFPGCSRLGCDHGKIRTPGGFDWCLCAKKVKVMDAVGPFASVTFNAEATKLIDQAGQSRVLLGDWATLSQHIQKALLAEQVFRLEAHINKTGGMANAKLLKVRLSTDREILAWEVAEETPDAHPASLDYGLAIVRLGFVKGGADRAAGRVLEAVNRRAAAGKPTWLCASAMPGAGWSPHLLRWAERLEVVEV